MLVLLALVVALYIAFVAQLPDDFHGERHHRREQRVAATMKRPALTEALERLDRGDADVLVAAKLDRVSRSVADFARLLERANTCNWRLRLLDLGVDTSTPAGEFVAKREQRAV